MEIKTRNTLIGAGIGAVAGGAVGSVAGIAKSKTFQTKIEEVTQQLNSIDTDAYIKEHSKVAKTKQIKAGLKPNKIQKNMKRVVAKATQDINALKSRLGDEIKNLTKTKNKTVAIIIAAGIAGGALIGGLIGRFITNKQSSQQQ